MFPSHKPLPAARCKASTICVGDATGDQLASALIRDDHIYLQFNSEDKASERQCWLHRQEGGMPAETLLTTRPMPLKRIPKEYS